MANLLSSQPMSSIGDLFLSSSGIEFYLEERSVDLAGSSGKDLRPCTKVGRSSTRFDHGIYRHRTEVNPVEKRTSKL